MATTTTHCSFKICKASVPHEHPEGLASVYRAVATAK
jgi:hypothetical protein